MSPMGQGALRRFLTDSDDLYLMLTFLITLRKSLYDSSTFRQLTEWISKTRPYYLKVQSFSIFQNHPSLGKISLPIKPKKL